MSHAVKHRLSIFGYQKVPCREEVVFFEKENVFTVKQLTVLGTEFVSSRMGLLRWLMFLSHLVEDPGT